jgi:hypothetical protein
LGADGGPDGLRGFWQHQKRAIVRSMSGSSGECRLSMDGCLQLRT